jgi:hypothetical protein
MQQSDGVDVVYRQRETVGELASAEFVGFAHCGSMISRTLTVPASAA